jgi:prepilin-type N-terminal cleavage/methylation domain-containing protein
MTWRAWFRDERGVTLPEVLVGVVVSALVMSGIVSAIGATADLQRRADDRNRIAGALSVVSLSVDRDGAMATAVAPAKSQTASTSCATPLNLGFLESGGAVRFQTSAHPNDGPLWLDRVSGAGTRTLAKNVSACTWQSVQEAGGRWTVAITLTITGPSGETASRVIRAAPRLWT